MPWTETNMHFSSQCLTQRVRTFLLSFFNCCYISVCALSKDRKKQLRSCPGWLQALAVHTQTPFSLAVEHVHLNDCLRGIVWVYSLMEGAMPLPALMSKRDFLCGHNFTPSPFPMLKHVAARRGANILGKQCPKWGEVLETVWTQLSVDFSWKDACVLFLVRKCGWN